MFKLFVRIPYICTKFSHRSFMAPSLGANNEKYKDNRCYWQGGVWPGATCMIPFGMDGLVTVQVKKRTLATQEPQVEITSNVPFELTVRWGDKEKTAAIQGGTQTV